jgi:hypothetical protein
VRQGNQHDEIDIFAYATEGSLDAQMWQNNERKARFTAAALSGDTSIRRLEDMGESQANQFAMAKAIASGDPRLMQKAGLEADIARLERLRAAHIDDQHAVRRQMRDAECDIELSIRRIGEISRDIERRVPTAGDAFNMTVMEELHVERKLGGRALMKEILTLVQLQQEGDTVIASIGGFDVAYSGERIGHDGYRYTTMLPRTGAEYEIELPVTTERSPASSTPSIFSRASASAIASASPTPADGLPPTSPAMAGTSPLPPSLPKSDGSWLRWRRPWRRTAIAPVS